MTILINNLIKLFIPLSLFIWALFMPYAAGYTYIAIYALFAGYLLYIDSLKPNPNVEEWSSQEIDIIRKYHLSLRFPVARDMSALLNGFRWASILWAILFLFNQMWFAAVFLVVAFFVSADISVRLDPFFFLGQAVHSGQMQFMQEYTTLQRVRNHVDKFNKRF